MAHRKASTRYARGLGRLALGLALLAGSLPQAAWSQAYPAKPIRLVVPSAAGGGLDRLTRVLSGQLATVWNQPVVVDNRPGASFIIGTDVVAKAPPDGYTILFVPATALTVNTIAIPDLPYNPQRDLAPVMVLSTSPFLLLVNSAMPAASAPELLALLRANPGKYNLGYTGATLRLASELFKSLAGVDFAEVSYKSAVQAATSAASGEIQMGLVDMASATAMLQSGRIRGLAVTTPNRFKLRPELPTLSESGVPGYNAAGLTVMAVPAKTPAEIIAKVNADLARVLALSDVRQSFEAIGNEVLASSVAEAAQILRNDVEKWSRLAKERNLRFQ